MKRIAILLAGAAVLTATHASAQTGQTVTWAGGNSYKSWLGATNWTPQVVPLNNAGTNFTVIVPDSTSLGYDSGGAGTIEALSFGISTLRVRGGNSLVVTGATVIKGLIDAQGASSAFRAKANVTVLQNYPRLWAADGATVGAAASTYTWDNNGGANTLVSSVGAGSLVELTNVTSFQVGYSGGQPVYSVYARSNGVIDLRNLGQITGPANDDWLDFNLNSSGDIRLDNLKRIAARVRFNLDLPTYTLPLLDRATETYFNLAPSNTLQLPALLSLSNGGIINAAYSRLDAPALLSVDNTPIQVGQGGSLVATNLLALDTVPLTLTSNGVFIAPKLAAYRNSLISYVPGQQLHSGNLTDIFASRLSASSGATGRVAAVTYDTPASWQWYGALFSADGGESLLDMSAMRTMQTRYCNWSGYDYRYMVNANNGGVIDLSGLETLIGPEYSNRLLEFNLKNGGNIRFPNLKQISGYTRFNVEIPLYAMPALESADNTLFVLSDGVRLQVPSLNRMAEGSSIQFGFNSTFEAPSLKSFVNSSLSLAPGNTLLAPWFTNIYASRFAVTGGSTCRVAAVIYDTPASWQWYGALFSADGGESLLDMSAMRTMQTRYCNWSGYDYRYMVNANNGGVIDLSGLETLIGPEYSNRLLEFNVLSGGLLRLGNASLSQYLTFNVSGTSSRLDSGGLYLRNAVVASVSGKATLQVSGDFRYENTDPNSIVVEGAYFQMDGALPQRLEVGGRDSGPSGFTSRNFGYSQLSVGSSNQTSVVRLVDTLNNGGRGAAGEPEALYLYGMDGAGLRILNGSRLVLNGLNAYAFVNGQMRSLRSLIPAGTNSVPFDGGFLANYGGPRITNMTPSVAVTPAVSSVDVAFDQPIAAASFTPADVSITGPGGAIPATGVALVSGTTWRISFAAQSADGTYTVRVGPNINELAANLPGLDQNSDGLGGDGTNDTFTGTFVIDGTAPLVVGAYALQNGNRVGLTFDEPVVPAFATNPANYSVNGAVPTAVALRTNGTQVVLTVSPTVGVTFPLVVSNTLDALGNTASRTVTGTILALEPRDIGSPGSDPRDTGSTVAFSETDFDSVGGGSSVWGTSDACHFVSEQRPGDFDVRVQITRLDRTGANSDGGIVLRQSLAGNSPKVQATVEPYSGGQRFYLGVRATAGGSVSYPAGLASSDNWIRLVRQGSFFIGFRSTNGVDWVEYSRLTNNFPTTGYLGLVTCSDDNTAGRAVTAWYRSYGDFGPSILTQPQNQSVASGANVTFGVTARGLPVLSYQWQLNGIPLPGETNSLLQLLAVNTNRVGNYRVVVSNPYGSTTSQEATLMVDGTGCGSFEADVAPRPNGNNAVTVSDWVQVGRVIAGLDTVLNSCEFQRVDCAPRTNAILGTLPLGDGRLSVADWTQAGRYAAAVDPLTQAGGPITPAAPTGNRAVLPAGHSAKDDGLVRSVRLAGCTAAQGQAFSVPVELTALGGENALGFSVQFDPTRLTYQGVSLADGAAGTALQVNASQADGGSVGVVLAKSIGQSFAAGTASVVRVQFRATGATGTNQVGFSDAPVWREVADVNADPQPAAYLAGTVRVVLPGRLSPDVRLAPGSVELRLTGEPGERYRVEVSPDLTHWTTVATVAAGADPVVVRDSAAGGAKQCFYRAVLVP